MKGWFLNVFLFGSRLWCESYAIVIRCICCSVVEIEWLEYCLHVSISHSRSYCALDLRCLTSLGHDHCPTAEFYKYPWSPDMIIIYAIILSFLVSFNKYISTCKAKDANFGFDLHLIWNYKETVSNQIRFNFDNLHHDINIHQSYVLVRVK